MCEMALGKTFTVQTVNGLISFGTFTFCLTHSELSQFKHFFANRQEESALAIL